MLKPILRSAHLHFPESCCVVDQHCTSPANSQTIVEPKTICFACGQKVCLNCSLVIKYMYYGRKRLCHDCLIQNGREDLVTAHIYRLSGYKREKGLWIQSLNNKYAEDIAHKAISLVDNKKIDSALDTLLDSVSLFQSKYRHDLVNHLIVSYLDFMRNDRQDKSLIDIEYCLAWSCRGIASDLPTWEIFAQRFIKLLESQNSPQYANIIRTFKKEYTPMAILIPICLVNPAKKAGIKVPENIDNYNEQDFPHWKVYLSMQILAPLPHPSAHFDNAKVVAAIPDDEIKFVTPEQLTKKGFVIGYSK